MRTRPEDISLTREEVDMASSRRRRGSERGSSWTAKVTWPRRRPKRVPVTFRPEEGLKDRFVGKESHLQEGRTEGKEKKLRRERRKEERVLVFVEEERELLTSGE